MDVERVNLETAWEHYGIWRWRVERDSSNRLVKTWSEIGASNMPGARKVLLANVAWAVAAFERAYDVLVEDIVRAERDRNVGRLAVMDVLTGPYQGSLDYLLGMGLWMDLGDVFVAYRTIRDRLGHLKRRGGPNWSEGDVEHEVAVLKGRTLPGLSPEPVTELATNVLHHTWDPSGAMTLPFTMVWKGADPAKVDFAEGDFRGALNTLVEETLAQIYGFISTALART